MQKSAIALTRLCSQSEAISREIIVIGGHLVLARICKDAKLRNFSDAVLVAALAALRYVLGIFFDRCYSETLL